MWRLDEGVKVHFNLFGLYLTLQPGSTSFKVLQLSDTHFDPYYEEGTNAECNEPLCCRLTNGPARNAADGAGKWGDYRKCDTPKRTIDHMFQHISSAHPVSLYYKLEVPLILSQPYYVN